MIQEISKKGTIIQFWDELNTFLDSIGLYNKSGGGLERSIINTLSNGTSEFKHELKSKQYEIAYPRLSVLAAGHPPKLITNINSEKLSSDGFFSRYFCCVPEPKIMTLSKIEC